MENKSQIVTKTLVNNTATDIRLIEKAIWAAINSDGKIPEELADTFVLRKIDDNRYALEWA